jgi:hypothetical protein
MYTFVISGYVLLAELSEVGDDDDAGWEDAYGNPEQVPSAGLYSSM